MVAARLELRAFDCLLNHLVQKLKLAERRHIDLSKIWIQRADNFIDYGLSIELKLQEHQ